MLSSFLCLFGKVSRYLSLWSRWSQALGMDIVICHVCVVIADVRSWVNSQCALGTEYNHHYNLFLRGEVFGV